METTMRILDDRDVLRRAHGDWSRKSGSAFRPCAARHVELYGLQYVVLFDELESLEVYRVRSNGQLKRLKQWPGDLEDVPRAAAFGNVNLSDKSRLLSATASPAGPEAASESSLRNHPEMLGFRLDLMRWRAMAATARNDEMMRRLDRAIEVTKKA
jgi:hypothetical protein